MTLRRALLLLVGVSLLGACSSVQLLYANLDRVVVWRATDYVELDRDQRRRLRQETRSYLHWHRQHQLLAWAALLSEVEGAVQTGIDAQQWQVLAARGEALLADMMARMVPVAVDLMASFSDAQIEGLKTALKTSNEELNANYEGLAESEQRAVWREKSRERLHRWVGTLTPEQSRLLAALSAVVEPDNGAWVAFREDWQAGLLDALAERGEGEVFQARIAELLLHRERWYSPRYAEIVVRQQLAYQQFAVDLINSLEPGQKQRLTRRINRLVRDFESLSERAAPSV